MYADSKDLAKMIVSDKLLKERAYEITLNPKCDEYQGGLASKVWSGAIATRKEGANANKWAKKLHKAMIKKFRKSM